MEEAEFAKEKKEESSGYVCLSSFCCSCCDSMYFLVVSVLENKRIGRDEDYIYSKKRHKYDLSG
ncbi:MAG: hypothetical protein HXN93_02145 [Prevotella pleuritidis]|nr:hypothetical protein [Hoylesella pleuritidis]